MEMNAGCSFLYLNRGITETFLSDLDWMRKVPSEAYGLVVYFWRSTRTHVLSFQSQHSKIFKRIKPFKR